MAAGEHPAGTASGHAFDLATAVAGGPEHWTAEVDPGWTVAGRPNGGYLLALATRAALETAGQPHPLAVSAHFLAPSDLGPAELEVRRLRAGRSLSTVRVTLVQEGAARLEALVTAGRIDRDADPGWRRSGGPDGAGLAGLHRPRPALAGRLVRRGGRGLGLGRPPGRPVPSVRRRPPRRPGRRRPAAVVTGLDRLDGPATAPRLARRRMGRARRRPAPGALAAIDPRPVNPTGRPTTRP